MKLSAERRRAIRAMLFAVVCVLVLIVVVLGSITKKEREFFQHQAELHVQNRLEALSLRLQDALPGITADLDEISTRRLVLREMYDPEVEVIAVFDRNGDFLEGMQRSQSGELEPWEDMRRPGMMHRERNLYLDSELVGHVLVSMNPRQVESFLLRTAMRHYAGIALIALLLLWSAAVSAFFAYDLGRSVSRARPRRCMIRRCIHRHWTRPEIPKRCVRPRCQTLGKRKKAWNKRGTR